MIVEGVVMVVVSLLFRNVSCCYHNYLDYRYYKTNCGTTEVPTDIPAKAREAWLNHNFITDIPLGIFSHLKQCFDLELDTNKLTVLKSGMFKGLKSLKRLNLGHNQITHIEPGSFRSLQLTELYLDNNRLTRPMKERDLINSQSLTLILTLDNNPLQCDSRMCWIRQAERDGWITWHITDGWGKPDCENYANVVWDDINLNCTETDDPDVSPSSEDLDATVFIVVGVAVGIIGIILCIVVIVFKHKEPKAHRDISDYNPAYQNKRPEERFTDVYDYIDESKVHVLLPLEIRQSPIGSESDHSASPEADPTVLFGRNSS